MFIRLCILGFLWGAMSSAQAVQIEASIKPLALIIEPLLLEGDTVSVLVKPGASPHDYALKASDLQRIEKAQLVVWTGPVLERFLLKPLQSKSQQQVLTLSDLEGMHWPHLDSEELDFDHSKHDSHDHGDKDPHFWLDPVNVKIIARAVSERLISTNPSGRVAYQNKLVDFLALLDKLHNRLSSSSSSYHETGFVVFHRGYDHFVGRYNLNQLAYITWSPEQKPGARHLYQLRKTLAVSARCVFIEGKSNMRSAENLAADLGIKTAELDPLGVDSETYYELMVTMEAAFASCLNQ